MPSIDIEGDALYMRLRLAYALCISVHSEYTEISYSQKLKEKNEQLKNAGYADVQIVHLAHLAQPGVLYFILFHFILFCFTGVILGTPCMRCAIRLGR